MRKSFGPAVAIPVGVLAVLVPLFLAGWLSWKEGTADQESRVLTYARDAMRRSEETAVQFNSVADRLEQAHFAPCSPAEINLMRGLDISSSYIQAVGRIYGDDLICDSLGTTHPIPLGPPTLTDFNGASVRLAVHLPLAPSHPFTIISKRGFAVFLEPSLPVDIAVDGKDVAVGMYIPSSAQHEILAQGGPPLDPSWFHPLQSGQTSTFVDHGTVVALVRSNKRDLVAIAAAPKIYLVKRMERFALIYIPIGLLCSFATAWAILTVFRSLHTLRSELQTAIRRNELYVVFQPIVDLSTRHWIGAEALVRWEQEGVPVSPSIFIPIAEQNGMITAITECVFELAGRELHRCTAVSRDFQLSINLAAADLASTHTLELVKEFVARPGIRIENLKLEATERGFLQGEETQLLLTQLCELGVSIAIDDFGTGYSSLSCLQTLPLDTLKIDKAFVETIGTDGATSEVVLHIIEMAHSLGLHMIAEGVETDEQAEFLLTQGVQFGQGWLFGKPIPIDNFCEALRAHAGGEFLNGV